jgi:diacylglycerol kinase (ATP)
MMGAGDGQAEQRRVAARSFIPGKDEDMKKRFLVAARIDSFGHASRGIGTMLRTQHNAWIHAAATALTIVAGICFGVSAPEWAVLILSMMAVWSAEALNTAFESLADVAHPDFHPLVRRAKDVAAGAVLICAAGAVAIGLLVFVPHIVD